VHSLMRVGMVLWPACTCEESRNTAGSLPLSALVQTKAHKNKGGERFIRSVSEAHASFLFLQTGQLPVFGSCGNILLSSKYT
jgi:hypothetical protein